MKPVTRVEIRVKELRPGDTISWVRCIGEVLVRNPGENWSVDRIDNGKVYSTNGQMLMYNCLSDDRICEVERPVDGEYYTYERGVGWIRRDETPLPLELR